MALTIYGIAPSRAFRTLWAARELGLPYEHVAHHYAGPEVKAAPFLAINPMGAIPAIVDDGFALSESFAINLYLARKAGKLWPRRIEGEGLAYQWTLFAATEIEPHLGTWWAHTGYLPEEKRKPALAAEAVPMVEKRFDVLDATLARRAWLTDDDFTIGDLNLAAALYRAPAFGLARWPKLADWHARCYARPAAKAAVAERETAVR